MDISSDDEICYTDFYVTDSDEEELAAIRGPSYERKDWFEIYFVYGNNVRLSYRRWDFLENKVSQIKPGIPLYVCEITSSLLVEGGGRMCFSLDYNQNVLKNHLREKRNLHEERNLGVTNELYKGYHEVMISMVDDGRAMITTRRSWRYVVRDAELLECEMAIFWFKECIHGFRRNLFSGILINWRL